MKQIVIFCLVLIISNEAKAQVMFSSQKSYGLDSTQVPSLARKVAWQYIRTKQRIEWERVLYYDSLAPTANLPIDPQARRQLAEQLQLTIVDLRNNPAMAKQLSLPSGTTGVVFRRVQYKATFRKDYASFVELTEQGKVTKAQFLTEVAKLPAIVQKKVLQKVNAVKRDFKRYELEVVELIEEDLNGRPESTYAVEIFIPAADERSFTPYDRFQLSSKGAIIENQE